MFLSVEVKTADIRTNTDHIGCFVLAKYSIDRKRLNNVESYQHILFA